MTRIEIGDCREVLRTLPDESVNCCVTSPPYWGLRDYGLEPGYWPRLHMPLGPEIAKGVKAQVDAAWYGSLGLEPTPELYVEHIVEVFREVRRVLRKDGVVFLNLGDSYASGGQNSGSTPESLTEKQRSNAGCRYERRAAPPGLKPKDLCGIPWRVAFALQEDGWYLRSEIIWHKPNPMPESVRDRPTKAHEQIFLLSKNERYFFNQEAVREQGNKIGTLGHLQGGDGERAGTRNGLRRGYVAAKRLDPGSQALDSFEVCGDGLYRQSRNIRSVWTIATQPYPEAHFATFPEEIAKRCILAGCPEGGVVLDPFAGSGTVGAVAETLGNSAILIEAQPKYEPLIARRLAQGVLTL